jgi:LemA protein
VNGLGLVALCVVGASLVVTMAWVSGVRKLKRLDSEASSALTKLDRALATRADLIPNLVGAAKSVTELDASVWQSVVYARTASIQADTLQEKAAADAALTKALDSLLASTEGNAALAKRSNYMDTRTRLVEAEAKLAVARAHYNDTVINLNSALAGALARVIARHSRLTSSAP